MAYDRFDREDGPRGDRSRWHEDRDREHGWRNRNQGSHEERGFFERAGDQIASWFGDEEAERRSREHEMRDDPNRRPHSRDRGGWGRERSSGSDRDWNENRGVFSRGGSTERDYNPGWQRELSSNRDRGSSEPWSGAERGRDRFGEGGRDYRPMTGDYSRHESEQFFSASGVGRGERGVGQYDREQSPWDRDDYRRTSRAGTSDRSDRSRHGHDPHYSSWRDQHMSELDRDYDDYRRENQSRFESEFGSWREKRQQKRGLLSQIREHMEVVGNDDQHIGKVDKVAGDRIILTKSDPESGGAHHSISCSDIDRVEGERVILDCSSDQARSRWRDESRGRALFERDDQGEMGPRMLDRSFEGTYR
jgi:hypothetical protein